MPGPLASPDRTHHLPGPSPGASGRGRTDVVPLANPSLPISLFEDYRRENPGQKSVDYSTMMINNHNIKYLWEEGYR